MKKIIITGINGFTGRHLVTYLKKLDDIEIVGIDQHFDAGINGYKIDLRNTLKLTQIFSDEKPDFIIHLAGINKAERFTDFYEGNVFTTINILESVIEADSRETGILLISSSAVYGRVPAKLVAEDSATQPVNFYGNSKMAMEYAARQYIENSGLRVNIVRPFNLIGPGQSTEFVLPSFIMQLLEIKTRRRKPVIKTGDLSGRRDFVDVRDAVSGYWKILQSGDHGSVYNLGSGAAVSIQDVLNRIISMIGIKVSHETDVDRIQKHQILEIASSNQKIATLGWKPERSLDDSLQEMIAYYEQNYFTGK